MLSRIKKHEFYYLSKDKEAVEVKCAKELNDAIQTAKKQFKGVHDNPCISTNLFLLLRGFPFEYKFTIDKRGSARQLCAEMRLFAEAVIAMTDNKDMNKIAYDMNKIAYKLKDNCKWAAHAPMTKYKREFWTHIRHIERQDLTGPQTFFVSTDESLTRYSIHEINETHFHETRTLFTELVNLIILNPKFLIEPEALNITDSPTVKLALETHVRDSKAQLSILQEELCIGKYGQYKFEPISTFQAHSWLFFEAAEHLVPSPSIDKPTLKDICLGIRLFTEVVKRAIFNMPLDKCNIQFSDKDEKNIMYNIAGILFRKASWAAHNDFYTAKKNPEMIMINDEYIKETSHQFLKLINCMYEVLKFFKEEPRFSMLKLAQDPTFKDDWRVNLYLGLSLKDYRTNKTTPSQTFTGPLYFMYKTFSWAEYDAVMLLLKAEEKIHALIDDFETCSDESLKRYYSFVVYELDYLVRNAKERDYGWEDFNRTIKLASVTELKRFKFECENCETPRELVMIQLGDELFDELLTKRPPTAKEKFDEAIKKTVET
jgi:hypothetical protein